MVPWRIQWPEGSHVPWQKSIQFTDGHRGGRGPFCWLPSVQPHTLALLDPNVGSCFHPNLGPLIGTGLPGRWWWQCSQFLDFPAGGRQEAKICLQGAYLRIDLTSELGHSGEIAARVAALEVLGHSMVSDSLWPWTVAHHTPLSMDFPGKNTEVGCHFLLWGIFPTQGSNLCLLHWKVDSSPVSPQRSPKTIFNYINTVFVMFNYDVIVYYILNCIFISRTNS